MTLPLNWLDRALAVVAPEAALRRGRARAALGLQPPAPRGRIARRAYDGAAIGRRVDAWLTPPTSADSEIARGLVMLRNRSRDLTRNNPHAKKAISVWANNIVGSGIVPRAKSGNAAVDQAANRLWDDWAKVADADGQLDLYGLQELAVKGMVEGGEMLIRKRLRFESDGLPVPLQLQLMEGDLLDERRSIALQNGAIVNGVEFDPIGQRRAYWLYPSHPGNMLLPLGGFVFVSSPVPADQVVHLYRKERTQARGVPWCAPVIMRLRDLDDYEDAEILRKKIEACVVAFVSGPDAADGLMPTSADTTTDNNFAAKDSAGNPIERYEPGMIAYLDGARQVHFNNPSQSGSYPDIQRLGLHSIAAGYLVPYELLTGDLSQVNFSSARVGLIEFRRLVEAVQWQCLIPMALQPIWNWFVETAYLAGKLPVRTIAVEWDTPAFQSVQPLDDVLADLRGVRAGFDSLSAIIARRTGRNPRVVIEEIAADAKLLDQFGLVLDSDPRNTDLRGNDPNPGQAQDPAQQDPQRGPRLVA